MKIRINDLGIAENDDEQYHGINFKNHMYTALAEGDSY